MLCSCFVVGELLVWVYLLVVCICVVHVCFVFGALRISVAWCKRCEVPIDKVGVWLVVVLYAFVLVDLIGLCCVCACACLFLLCGESRLLGARDVKFLLTR